MEFYLFPFGKVPKDSKIVIYGAGRVAESYLSQIMQSGYCECLFIADRNYARLSDCYNVAICAPDDIFKSCYDLIVVAAMRSHKNITASLIEKGIPQEKIVCDINTIVPDIDIGDYYIEFRKHPIEDGCILYESFFGAGMIDNPYAIFAAMQKMPMFNEYRHIWIISDKNEIEKLKTGYNIYANVIFILRSSREAAYYYATAKYLIQNNTFPFFFAKRKEQVLLSTWHSITVKALGFDMPGGIFESKNILRCLMQSNYIIAAGSFMTDIFLKSYKLEGLFNGMLIEEGHPRTDLTLAADKNIIFGKLADRGVDAGPSRKIILYAPTWKGESFSGVRNDFDDISNVRQQLQAMINCNEYQILIKPHSALYDRLTTQQQNNSYLVPPSIDTNELLCVVDILISDYSSIFFDFMVTGRPVLFYIPDYKQYSRERGILFDLNELPGPVTADVDELGYYLNNIEDTASEYTGRYDEMKNRFCKYDDGNAGRRIIDIIFNGNRNYNLICPSTDKIKLLFYPGNMRNNGVTESFLTLLDSIDYGMFDVSVHCNDENMENVSRINKNARVFIRCGELPCTFAEHHILQDFLHNGYPEAENIDFLSSIFERDFARCFGNADFDYVIEYFGYGVFYAALLSASEKAKRIIYQHNDLMQDFQNKEKQALYMNPYADPLKKVLSIYPHFDKIVSVSEALMKVNCENLSDEHTRDRFTYINNLINIKRTKESLFVNQQPINESAAYKFVTVGRLSPEKNHRNLVKGFAKFKKDYSSSALYIIGSGELENEIRILIEQLNLQDSVFLTGQSDNPFGLMRSCDCFILPSVYEGQGLVVNEARVLGMPIIISDYSAAESVCIPGGQLIIGTTPDDIYSGMTEFAKGNVPADYDFDPDAYNAECMRQFEALFLPEPKEGLLYGS